MDHSALHFAGVTLFFENKPGLAKKLAIRVFAISSQIIRSCAGRQCLINRMNC